MTTIRIARLSDADAVVQVVRRSITELCVADHQRDAATLADWLANKTPQNFRAWIADADNFCVVAEMNGKLSGVGLLHRSGEIRLFYLAPDSQRQGMGRAIHMALEEQAHAWGLVKLHLESTGNARFFYEAMGYTAAGNARKHRGAQRCYPYEKSLRH